MHKVTVIRIAGFIIVLYCRHVHYAQKILRVFNNGTPLLLYESSADHCWVYDTLNKPVPPLPATKCAGGVQKAWLAMALRWPFP